MRSLLTTNWPLYLQSVVNNLNSLPSKYLNGLSPGSIHSAMQDPEVDAARREAKGFQESSHWPEWIKQQKLYEGNPKFLQKNQYCYANFSTTSLSKSFDYQASIILLYFYLLM